MLCQNKPDDFYVGPSMYPTLKPLDRLKLIHYGARTVRAGDVVVFRPPVGGQRVTHRVVKSNAESIMTRGDNNPLNDPWTLTHEKILGQVVSARRNARWVTIHGGLRGRIRAVVMRSIRWVKRMIYRLTQAIYRTLIGNRNNRLKLKLPVQKIFRIVSFQRPKGIEFQLFIGSRLVARRPGENGQWRLRRPYTWFLDEESLPEPPSGSDKESMPCDPYNGFT